MLAKIMSIKHLFLVFALCSSSALADTSKPASEQNLRIAMLAAETHFDTNTMKLTPAGVVALQGLIARLDEFHEILSIRIVGHTDDVGSLELNKALSQQRANYIKQSFSEKYAKAHVISIGMGEAQPIATNESEAGRERNRRVEIQIIARGYMPVVGDEAATNN